MKKTYQTPEIEFERFDIEDIITDSSAPKKSKAADGNYGDNVFTFSW